MWESPAVYERNKRLLLVRSPFSGVCVGKPMRVVIVSAVQ